MIKILVISSVRLINDGIFNVIFNYFRNMSISGLQMDFCFQNQPWDELINEFKKEGSQVYVLKNRNKNPLNYLFNLSKIIENEHYDIIHAHGNSTTLAVEMIAGYIGGAKIRIAHSHNSMCKYKLPHKLLRFPFEKFYTHAFACSEKAGLWLFKQKSFNIIKNGINIEDFSFKEDVRHRYRENLGFTFEKVIGHVGHFSNQKNHDFLIDVFNSLFRADKSYRLLLIGENTQNSKINEKIRRKVNLLGLHKVVKFLGPSTEVSSYLQAMDIFILPSIYEGLPLTLIEAQTAGLPCIVSDVVSQEGKVTNLVHFVPLNEGPLKWSNEIKNTKIINRTRIKHKIKQELISAKYDLHLNAKELKKLYIDIYNTTYQNR